MAETAGNSARSIVLLHGFGADRLSFAFNEAAFAAFGAVRAIELPGHGESPDDPGDGSMAHLLEAFATRLDSLADGPVDLAGHSLGGGLALAFAAGYPEQVRSLFLVAPIGLAAGIDRTFVEELPRLADPEAAAALLARLVARPKLINAVLVQRVLDHLERPGRRAALAVIGANLLAELAAYRAAATDPALKRIRRTVVWGADDGISPPDEAAIAAFGGAFVSVPGAGHMPHMERPAVVNRVIVEHFDA